MGWDYSESFTAFQSHNSRDGLASESKGADGQDLEQLEGAQESQRSVELYNTGPDDRLSPPSAKVLSNVEAQAKQWKDQRRNRQDSC